VPPNTAHAVVTTSPKPLKVLSVQSPQFLGQDRIVIEEPDLEVTTTDKSKKDKNKKSKNKKIPEFEGAYD